MNEDEGMDGDERDVGDGTDDEDEVNLMDYIHKKSKKRAEPSMDTVKLWGQYRKKTTDFRQDDWRTMGSLPNVNAYTDHPGAVMFKAPEVDAQAPKLKFKDKRFVNHFIFEFLTIPYFRIKERNWRSFRQ